MRLMLLRLFTFAATVALPTLAMATPERENGQLPVGPIPEPTAALVFAIGGVIVAGAIRRQRQS